MTLFWPGGVVSFFLPLLWSEGVFFVSEGGDFFIEPRASNASLNLVGVLSIGLPGEGLIRGGESSGNPKACGVVGLGANDVDSPKLGFTDVAKDLGTLGLAGLVMEEVLTPNLVVCDGDLGAKLFEGESGTRIGRPGMGCGRLAFELAVLGSWLVRKILPVTG